MKSECELFYDRFVVSNLCHAAVSEKERVSLMLDFINSREERYDQLCEHVYQQAFGETSGQSLWLTPVGESYLAADRKSQNDICLLPVQNQMSFDHDTTVQIHLTCKALENALQNMGVTVL